MNMDRPAAAPPTERSWVELDAAAIRHNLAAAQVCAGRGGWVMAVVKADAYGLGARLVAPFLEEAGADCLAVATLEEARELRALGLTRPIYILSPAAPGERAAIVSSDLGVIPAVSAWEEAVSYSDLAQALGKKLLVHLVLDTGMGRIGLHGETAAVIAEAQKIAALPGLAFDSIASHFPSADEDADFTARQLAHYHALLTELAAAGLPVHRHHIANSAGALGQPRHGREIIRAGLMLYGVSPLPARQDDLRNAVTWKTRVVQTRTLPAGHGVSYGRAYVTAQPTRVATLSVGYADGYPRSLSGKDTWVWLNGARCPLLGRVTMDQIMVEAPESAQPGDLATLMGSDGPSPAELARRASTIPYEIFCGLGKRVGRVLV